ncbi:MAG: ATP-grasp domain-containing protein [Desulfobacterales bacterium]|nr:ATP-grasp domain-containing protein [Desulfobacterales bacterium]
MSPSPHLVAIGARLREFPEIETLGFKPNFQDYAPREQALLLGADLVLYPTAFYADLFNAMGKKTFPSYHTYKFTLDKIRQTAIFQMQGVPHPKTRVFYGKKQCREIPGHFSYPFVAKTARGSARGNGVFLIHNREELEDYLALDGPAYIQEYLPVDRDMRLIVIGKKVALGYWRSAPEGEFKTNLSLGGEISFAPIPRAALDLAVETAVACGWNDVGIDIIQSQGKYYVLEGNMKYGTQGFKAAGLDYKKCLRDIILEGDI